MNLPNVYTKKWAGFDVRYWFTLLLLVIIALICLGFKTQYLSSCPLQDIKMEGMHTNAGLLKQTFLKQEPIQFNAPTDQAKSIEWFVNDKSISKEESFQYKFEETGKYVVKMIVDQKCDYYAIVNILPYAHYKVTAETVATSGAAIEGNELFDAGTITYFTTQLSASSYEWQILEMPEYGIKTDQMVGYAIVAPGQYTLQLKLDNDPKKVYTKTLMVNPPKGGGGDVSGGFDVPKPIELPIASSSGGGAETPEENHKPVNNKIILPDNEVLSILKLIRDDKKQLSDLTSSMCNGGNTKVLANDDKVMTLAELTELLQSKKWALGRKPKVNSIRTVRDDADGNCISVIYIKYK